MREVVIEVENLRDKNGRIISSGNEITFIPDPPIRFGENFIIKIIERART